MATSQRKPSKRGGRLLREVSLRAAVCLTSATLMNGCVLIGYDGLGAWETPDPDGENDSKGDAGPSGTESDASAPEASFDAATDGSAPYASDGSLDAKAEEDLHEAGVDGSMGGATDGATDATTDAATDGGPPLCDGAACDPRCDLTGTFALKLTVPATWPTSGQVGSGSGTFEFRLRLRANQVGDQVTIQLRECGQVVPAILAWLPNEDHLFTYPNSLYDAEVLPSVAATMTLGDSTPTSALSLPPVAMQMGLNLNDPLTNAWPSAAANLVSSVRVDTEADGNPGVTAIYSNAGNYEYPRTSTALVPKRAQQAYVAVRWIFSMTGALKDCDSSVGDVAMATIDSRILGCRHADGSLCSASEANHLDTNLPQFKLGKATYVLSRVADGATCAAVRTALP